MPLRRSRQCTAQNTHTYSSHTKWSKVWSKKRSNTQSEAANGGEGEGEERVGLENSSVILFHLSFSHSNIFAPFCLFLSFLLSTQLFFFFSFFFLTYIVRYAVRYISSCQLCLADCIYALRNLNLNHLDCMPIGWLHANLLPTDYDRQGHFLCHSHASSINWRGGFL